MSHKHSIPHTACPPPSYFNQTVHAPVLFPSSFRPPTMPAVATVTHSTATTTATPTTQPSSSSSSLSSGAIAAIVIGSLLAFVLFLALLFYHLRRYRRHSFTRVPSPPRLPTNLLRLGAKRPSVHSKKPSVSSEPLISPVSWPPIPHTSRVHLPSTPRSDSLSPGVYESGNRLGEVSQATMLPTAPPVLNIPPLPKSEQPPSPQTLFVHRMLQSRARASDFVAPSHHSSLDSALSPSATVDYANQLISDAERAALCDVEKTRKEEEDWEQGSTTESNYSQPSASLDHSSLLDRQNTVQRRKSSRRRPPTAELTPVTEVPDTPRARCDTLSLAANSSLDAQVSHGTASRPMSMVLDENGTFPLLTSVDFGKESAASGTTLGSISSTVGLGSSSSGRASRYPSLAPSSILQSSQSGSRSDGDTDWRHPPPGLSGLKTLQIGLLRNPHSPVEEHREQTDAAPDNRAHLRQGTSSSVPEVERRVVIGSGIARIDVAF